MGDLRVLRWRKYGKDRLYVSDAMGQSVGWVDLLTGDATIEQPAQADAFLAAVAAHHAEAATDVADSVDTAAPPHPAVPSPRPSPEPAWVDLAGNRPGQGARELADAELAAMKERSRVGTFIARTFDMKTEERAWRVGAGGEETVGGRLEKLVKHGWHVLQSGLQANTVKLYRAVCAAFPAVSSWGGRSGSGDHSTGRALDIMCTGSLGDSIANYVRSYAFSLGVSEVIWEQRIWSVQQRRLATDGGPRVHHGQPL